MSETVVSSVADKVATIRLNRPEKLNAFTDDMITTWVGLLEEYRSSEDVNVIVITGTRVFFSAWRKCSTRAGTPRPVVLRLNREINRALQAPEVRKPLLDAGHELASGTPEDLEKMIREELPRWAKVAKDRHIEIE